MFIIIIINVWLLVVEREKSSNYHWDVDMSSLRTVVVLLLRSLLSNGFCNLLEETQPFSIPSNIFVSGSSSVPFHSIHRGFQFECYSRHRTLIRFVLPSFWWFTNRRIMAVDYDLRVHLMIGILLTASRLLCLVEIAQRDVHPRRVDTTISWRPLSIYGVFPFGDVNTSPEAI